MRSDLRGHFKMNIQEMEEKAKYLRREAFEIAIRAGKGHLGGSFSCVEVLISLYYGEILNCNPNDPERDRFILSKGHAKEVYYVLLADLGFFPKSELQNASRDGSFLGGHSDQIVPGIEVSTGSLGHGLGIGCGIALGAALNGSKFYTYVLLGDGECQEGSVWEAAMFAGHHKLSHLVAIVDRNRLGSEDNTELSVRLEPLAEKWEAFNWNVRSRFCDGHDFSELLNDLDKKNLSVTKPNLIVVNTIKGKGISSLENQIKSHHTLPKGFEIEIARQELN